MRNRLDFTAEREIDFIPVFKDAPCKIMRIFLEQDFRNHFIPHLYRGRCKRNDVRTKVIAESLSAVLREEACMETGGRK